MAETFNSELLSTFAHDLRQPLRSIMMHAQRIQRQDLGVSEETKRFLEEIIRAARKQDEVIAGVMEYDQAGYDADGHLGVLPLPLAIQSAFLKVEAYRKECNGTIGYSVSAIPNVDVPQPLSKVFEKVLHNALKFRKPDVAPRVTIKVEAGTQDHCTVRIADDGVGIDPQYRVSVLRPFQKLHSANIYPGSGMGLAICHRIMHGVGGTICLEDGEEGRGTTVVLTCPIG